VRRTECRTAIATGTPLWRIIGMMNDGRPGRARHDPLLGPYGSVCGGPSNLFCEPSAVLRGLSNVSAGLSHFFPKIPSFFPKLFIGCSSWTSIKALVVGVERGPRQCAFATAVKLVRGHALAKGRRQFATRNPLKASLSGCGVYC
jgi:hypothetical protein